MTDTTFVCPKCQAAMRTYERSGIVIEQCTECRGIFLDRGELERLMDAEMAAEMAASSGPRRDEFVRDREREDRDREYGRDRDGHDRDDRDDRDDDRRRHDGRGRPIGGERRRESRFGGLFDIFGGD